MAHKHLTEVLRDYCQPPASHYLELLHCLWESMVQWRHLLPT